MVAFRQKHLLLTLVQGTTWAQNYLGKVTIPVLKIKQMYDTSELRLSWVTFQEILPRVRIWGMEKKRKKEGAEAE